MKKLIYILMFCPLITLGQNEKITTTDEEFNYLFKEYKIDIENGNQNKLGYTLEKIMQFNIDNFTIIYSSFKNNKGVKKAILVTLIKNKESSSKVFYRCLPINRPDLRNKVGKSFMVGNLYDNSIGSAMCDAFQASLYEFAAEQDILNK
jgi:hypothetical protein